MEPPRSPRPSAAAQNVSRRLLLVGGFAASTAALLARLPGGAASARSPVVEVLPAVVARGDPDAPGALGGAAPEVEPGRVFDMVIAGGRVIDPATGFDRVADVGIDGASMAAISTEALRGRRSIDAAGRVVAPGFIDLLSYDPNAYGVWFKVADGVTTNLGMHGINAEPGPWLERFGGEQPPVNYGGAFDHAWARSQLGVGVGQAADAAQLRQLRTMAEQGLVGGWIGVHVEPEYTPGAGRDEVVAMGEVASAAGVGLYVHGRYSDDQPPGTNAETLQEVLDTARATGAAVHVEHITSTGGTFTMEASLATLAAARDEGIDVTACMYPYTFWATNLASARFAPGWQERFRLDFDDLVVPGTGRRLTATSFAQAKADNALVAAMGAIPETDVVTALRSPFVMIGSDAILEEGDQNHPRAAGTFSRVLGRYVRDEGVLTLADALAKMTILPAVRLQGAAPAMARKGRLQVGADADITIFDPAAVADLATVEDPSQESVGIDWVLVAGQAVKTPDGLQRDVRPGRPITGQ